MSHAGITVEDDTLATPETRRQAREGVNKDESHITVESGAAPGLSPEEALKQAQAALANKDKELEQANARTLSAEQVAANARDEAARQRQQAQGNRKQTIQAAQETAKADKAAAEAILRQARTDGDVDAELKAGEALASANYRLNKTKDDLESLGTDGGQGGGQDDGQGGGGQPVKIAPETQEWIGQHPRFKTDKAYRDAAMAAHGQAVLDGIMANSPAYFRELDKAVKEFEKAERGGDNGGRDMSDDTRHGSEGAPPNRGSGGHGGASRTVKTKLGDLTVSKRADGKLSIFIPPGVRPDFEEGAKICGMNLGDYAYEQVKITDEIASGATGGLITEEGSRWQ